ncbi:hypothetical protein BT63DRAFT_454776 [Microthyrium microscopicum]|uniref:Uncharacterized protein n=1 Tax=Microthyrium microscopicum TaxID=703497 RepID=A0A6A6UE28_9PEZI|nr:hypothetical protein BT63DRAFT_454776 [Microthyrium microscopicum]
MPPTSGFADFGSGLQGLVAEMVNNWASGHPPFEAHQPDHMLSVNWKRAAASQHGLISDLSSLYGLRSSQIILPSFRQTGHHLAAHCHCESSAITTATTNTSRDSCLCRTRSSLRCLESIVTAGTVLIFTCDPTVWLPSGFSPLLHLLLARSSRLVSHNKTYSAFPPRERLPVRSASTFLIERLAGLIKNSRYSVTFDARNN